MAHLMYTNKLNKKMEGKKMKVLLFNYNKTSNSKEPWLNHSPRINCFLFLNLKIKIKNKLDTQTKDKNYCLNTINTVLQAVKLIIKQQVHIS